MRALVRRVEGVPPPSRGMEITEENLEIVIVEPPELDIGAARALVALIAAKRVEPGPDPSHVDEIGR